MRWGVLILLGVFFVSFASAAVPEDCGASMIAYWQFEGDADDAFGIYNGSGDVGVLYNEVLKVGNAAKFSGGNKVTVSGMPSEPLESSFTVEFWMRYGALSSVVLFEKGNYKIEFLDTMEIVASVGATEVSTSGIMPGTDYHVALVWDPNTPPFYLTLYINGVKVNETSLGSAGTAAGDIIIGDGFTGLIDELAIYSTDLSDAVIEEHYNLTFYDKKDYCSGVLSDGTETNFRSGGCIFPWEGGFIGVSKGECADASTGSAEGHFYCGENTEGEDYGGWFTTSPYTTGSLGCANGDEDYVWAENIDVCCPDGNYFCNETGDGTKEFVCHVRTDDCFKFNGTAGDAGDAAVCNSHDGCIYWCDGRCLPDTDDLLCGDYCESDPCNDDDEGLADNLDVTGSCGRIIDCDDGTQFTVECSCFWEGDAATGKCVKDSIASETFYDIISGDIIRKIFACTEDCVAGDCVEGKQDVDCVSSKRTIDSDLYSWLVTDVPEDCWDALGCMDGAFPRSCGEPIVKMPGFSLFALFASLFVVGLYYIKKP